MFICFLAGGLAMSITIGIVDVLFVQADAVKTQGSVSASVDLALGLCLLTRPGVVGVPESHLRLNVDSKVVAAPNIRFPDCRP